MNKNGKLEKIMDEKFETLPNYISIEYLPNVDEYYNKPKEEFIRKYIPQ